MPRLLRTEAGGVTEAALVEQPSGKEPEYRIITVNKSGEGKPSNTLMVVLQVYER